MTCIGGVLAETAAQPIPVAPPPMFYRNHNWLAAARPGLATISIPVSIRSTRKDGCFTDMSNGKKNTCAAATVVPILDSRIAAFAADEVAPDQLLKADSDSGDRLT